jgi:hypothetical protein
MAGINPQAGSGGRIARPLLTSGGADFDGITSTTDTTVSSESVYVPEGYQCTFVIDVDAFTTAAITAAVQFTLDGSESSPNWMDFYWDRASATAATVALAATGYKTLRFINPFPSDPDGNILFRLALKTDGADSSAAYGDCFLFVNPVPYANPRFAPKMNAGSARC